MVSPPVDREIREYFTQDGCKLEAVAGKACHDETGTVALENKSFLGLDGVKAHSGFTRAVQVKISEAF